MIYTEPKAGATASESCRNEKSIPVKPINNTYRDHSKNEL